MTVTDASLRAQGVALESLASPPKCTPFAIILPKHGLQSAQNLASPIGVVTNPLECCARLSKVRLCKG